jgi:hypothetical protein
MLLSFGWSCSQALQWRTLSRYEDSTRKQPGATSPTAMNAIASQLSADNIANVRGVLLPRGPGELFRLPLHARVRSGASSATQERQDILEIILFATKKAPPMQATALAA